MDLTTNGVVITDAIKFVQTNKEKLMSQKDSRREAEGQYHKENKDESEKEREENRRTTNRVF